MYDLIPLALIDEPENPQRETMEPEDLGDLSISIREVGLVQPLVVFPRGKRYEVSAGHRRLLACRMANYTPVPCIVKGPNGADTDAIKVHENAFREAVNAVEEARFYVRLLKDRCKNDVDRLCLLVRRRREYVEDRLLILRMDERIINALHEKRISLAVARELAKVRDPKRLLVLLDVATVQGATARQVAEWRSQTDRLPDIGDSPNIDSGTEGQPALIPPEPFMRCIFCSGTEDTYLMEMFWAHKPCKQILNRILRQQAATGAEE